MKALIVYYSRTGTTKKVAEALASMLQCDIEELVDKNHKSRKELFGYLRCGREAMKRILPEIEKTKKNPATYDLVIIGTPIWGWNMSSPIRTFLSQNKDKLKRVAFFCTMGGNYGNAFAEMEEVCGKKPIASLALKQDEVKKQEHIPKLKEFAKKIIRD